MKKIILTITASIMAVITYGQFPTTAQNWTIPAMENSGTDLDQVFGTGYSLLDINGDGIPDLIDARDQNTGSVWVDGDPYWKVYINSGSGFSASAQNWTIPAMENSGSQLGQVGGANYSLVDINGDGKPDLVDAQDQNTGSVWVDGDPYWKVYINSGSGFSTSAQNWTIPAMENSGTQLDQVGGANYSLVDINGDGIPDLVDAQDQNTGSVWVDGDPYWKVYINSGTGFSASAQNWTIPAMENSGTQLGQVGGANYSLLDINGDGIPDLVDAEDQNTGSVWVSGDPYWKVYINSGTGFSASAQNWTIPAMENSGTQLGQVGGANFSLLDINGDGAPDLVDAQDQNTGSVWVSGDPYWKVYMNSGSGFSSSAQNWTIPAMENSGTQLDQVSGASYTLIDITGNGYPDLVDAQDQNTGSVWVSGNPYWKVYSNILSVEENQLKTNLLNIYPNPTSGVLNVSMNEFAGESQIRIINNLGAVMYETTVSSIEMFEYDIESFNSGLYFISLINNDTVYTSKIIKR